MDTDEYKKYTILENILQKINQKYVALPADETKRNNKILQVIVDGVVQQLRAKSALFDNMYQNKFYGGSFYDGLKVGKPSEFDLDCLLSLPKIAKPAVEVSDKPGYVHIVFSDFRALETNAKESLRFAGLDKLLDGNHLSTKKVKGWMEGLMAAVVSGTVTTDVEIDDKTRCSVKYKVVKSGPALTIKMEGEHNQQSFTLDVDLVPCFTFFDDQWPRSDYKENPSKTRNTFFVVPKSPNEECPLYWRLSFQEQERELITSYSVLKPSIRLIKKIRDRHQHKSIASYYIKTVFLWELETIDKNLWSRSLSFVLAMMLRRYSDYIERKRIPYYWNSSYNLIADLSDVTASSIANKLRNIVEHIDRICNTKSDLYGVLKYFLSSDEVDVEAFKQEVPLNKKLLKQISNAKPQEIPTTVVGSSASSASSTSSSFEEVTKEMCLEAPQQTRDNHKLEILLLTLVSEQKRMSGMLESAIDRIGHCEGRIKELTCELNKMQIEDVMQRKEMMDLLGTVNRKIDGLKKADSSFVDDDILSLTRRFENISNL